MKTNQNSFDVYKLTRVKIDLIKYLDEISITKDLVFHGKQIDKDSFCDGINSIISSIDDVLNTFVK